MKFKKNKLYKVIKRPNRGCIGCILKYIGANKNKDYVGTPVKLGKWCRPYDDWRDCGVFQEMIEEPERTTLIEYSNMVEFCKKLKKELDNESKNNV